MSNLTEEEIMLAQFIINQKSCGVYELRNIYAQEWEKIKHPTSFGAKFKKSVDNKELDGIRRISLKSNNHHTYEIYKVETK